MNSKKNLQKRLKIKQKSIYFLALITFLIFYIITLFKTKIEHISLNFLTYMQTNIVLKKIYFLIWPYGLNDNTIIFLKTALENPQNIHSLIIGLITFLCLTLMFFYTPNSKYLSSKKSTYSLIAIIVLGIVIRIYMAYVFPGNFDMTSWENAAKIYENHQNIYSQTKYYNYSPIWFWIIGLVSEIGKFLNISFTFLIRLFLTAIDLLTLFVLIKIINEEKGKRTEKEQLKIKLIIAILFFLNPVSFLLTGYHGQFENLSILFVTIGVWLLIKYKNSKKMKHKLLIYFSLTIAMIIKHSFFQETLIGFKKLFKKRINVLFWFGTSCLLFATSFLPYISQGLIGIINNVLKYSSTTNTYGFSSLFYFDVLKYCFILGLIIYPFFVKTKDIVTDFLLGTLFFLGFTTGMAIQYLIMPIALGSLRRNNWFLLYSVAATMYIVGNSNNIFLIGFTIFPLNIIWLVVLLWFIYLQLPIKLQQKLNQHIIE
ncbi:MAG: hypothetical protein WC758_04490 [Candidatus Woesearchaeota archaeon]|jgi:hypothetical protein